MTTGKTLTTVLQVVRRIGEAEMAQAPGAMDPLLHPELVFRRADGSVAGKKDVLDTVPRRHYDIRVPEIVEVEAEPVARTAVVTVVVRAKGSVEPKEAGGAATVFDGTWRNVMVLERDDTDDWTCRLWVNTRMGVTVETLHHVSVPVTDLERSRRFYSDILGLRERPRPPFDFDGAWYQLGHGQLHLIVHKDRPSPPTFREGKPVDSRDVHFAVRVRSFRETLSFLQSRGYSDAEDELLHMRVSPAAIAGFPQIYILDPDRHVVELNAERLDEDKVTGMVTEADQQTREITIEDQTYVMPEESGGAALFPQVGAEITLFYKEEGGQKIITRIGQKQE